MNLYCDGGMNGHTNPCDSGIIFSVGREHADGSIEILTGREVDETRFSNNDSEWMALNRAIAHLAVIDGATTATIHSDSQLIVNQFNRRWACNEERLQTLMHTAHQGAAFLRMLGVEVEVVWVRREENVRRLGH